MTWMLIDGNNWFARDWYATRNAKVTGLAGQFLKRLSIIRDQYDLDRVVICWDSPDSFRRGVSATYKSNRTGKPDDFLMALPRAQAEIMASPLAQSYQCSGFEADDLLATLSTIAKGEGERAIIFSSDADLHQLLAKDLISQATSFQHMTATRYGLKVITADLLERDYGVKPWQWVDYRTIVGDKSDGIGGVAGLGPAVARAVLKNNRTLDEFSLNPWSVHGLTDRQRTLLIQSKASWPQLRQLLTLRTDVPLPATFFEALHAS